MIPFPPKWKATHRRLVDRVFLRFTRLVRGKARMQTQPASLPFFSKMVTPPLMSDLSIPFPLLHSGPLPWGRSSLGHRRRSVSGTELVLIPVLIPVATSQTHDPGLCHPRRPPPSLSASSPRSPCLGLIPQHFDIFLVPPLPGRPPSPSSALWPSLSETQTPYWLPSALNLQTI